MNNLIGFSMNSDKNKIACQEPTERIVEIMVKAPLKASENARTIMNLALVIDRSGSMSGRKLEYAKLAAKHVVELLGENDRLSLVSFDDEVQVHASAVLVNSIERRNLLNAISNLHSGNSTFLSGGWLSGCQAIASEQLKSGLNRTLLLTDGQANVGIVDPQELGVHASELNERGVSTTTLGVGLDFDHFLMERMAEMGGGNYYFIEDPQSIPSIFQRELNELFQISARAVEIIIQHPGNVNVQVFGGWRIRNDEKGSHIFLGDLASEQQKEIYLRLITPPQSTQETIEITGRIFARDETDGILEELASTVLQYVDKTQEKNAEEDAELMRRFTIVDNAEVANEALKLERAGHNAQASAMLHQKTMMNSSRMTQNEINEYESLSTRMNQGLNESDRKQSNYDANIRRKTRDH